MKKLLVTLAVAVGMVGLSAAPALAHHVVGISVETSCEGYVGSATLNVFGGHKYQVTAPGFDTGLVTEGGDNHNIVVPFSGAATSGTITATIFNPNGSIENGPVLQTFFVEGDCNPPPPVLNPKASLFGPCGDPMYRATFDNSGSTGPVVFHMRYINGAARIPRVISRKVGAGKVVVDVYRHVEEPSWVIIRAAGKLLVAVKVNKHNPHPPCPA